MSRPVGRPPKPVEKKRRTGNPGKRKLPAKAATAAKVLPTPARPPTPLRPLLADGLAAWQRAWAAGAAWLSPRTDLELLQLVCEQLDERTTLRARVLVAGSEAWRDRNALRALDKQIADGWSMLGFDPASRTRLGGLIGGPVPTGPTPPDGEGVTQPDDLEAFRQRAAARRT